MSGARMVLVAAAGAGVAAWVVIGRERAARQAVAEANAPFLYEGGGGGGELVEGGGFAATVERAAGSVLDFFDGALMSVGLNASGRWLTQAKTEQNLPYFTALQAAEAKYGIPTLMLVRLCYQESRYNPHALNRSSGAAGIMQIVPRWHPGVDPYEPFAAIDYAARYLRDLFRQFGTWEYALMAYNWGPANLKNYLAGQGGTMPSETANYARMILSDIGARGSIA